VRRTVIAAALGVTAICAQSAAAQDTAPPLACEFKNGASWSYEGGAFQSKPPSPLSFEIDSIDLEGQSAVLKMDGAPRTGTVRIVRAINANHFLEVVNEGFLNLTTVYDKDPATGLHPAVHSRHFGFLGEPVFAQYTGACREK
jgi:hypothetical protein